MLEASTCCKEAGCPNFGSIVRLCPNSCPYPHWSLPISTKQHWKLKFHDLKPSVIVILPKKNLSTKSSKMMVGKRSAYWNGGFFGGRHVHFPGFTGGAGMLLANQATSDITKADCAGAKVCEPVKSVPQLPCRFKKLPSSKLTASLSLKIPWLEGAWPIFRGENF